MGCDRIRHAIPVGVIGLAGGFKVRNVMFDDGSSRAVSSCEKSRSAKGATLLARVARGTI